MEGCIVHHKDRVWLRPLTTVVQQLLDELFKLYTICASRKDTVVFYGKYKNAIVFIGKRYVFNPPDFLLFWRLS